jgi:molybdopterin-guanine dinucleotide biosynthesis protein A
MTGIILAGGENKRMGVDKAFLTVAGMPMIDHVLRALRSVVHRIIIVTNSPERYRDFDVTVVTDRLDLRGPLTGIYSGICSSESEYNVVVACDMPFLNAGLLSYLMELAPGFDAVVPAIGGLTEPLHAVYSKKLLPAIEERIRENKRRIQGIFAGANIRYVTEKEISRFDPERRSFINLNTPQQYKEATCSDSECRNCS